MSPRTLAAAALVAGAALLLFFTPTGQTLSQNIERVIVTNFPEVQRITGSVNVENPIRLARMVTFGEIIVPPVKPTETTRLVEAGTLTTDGFPNVVLSVHGVVRGEVKRTGDVGLILIPEDRMIQDAFNEMGFMHFALEALASGVSTTTPYFASNQPRYTVGFQSYKLFMFNTTDKTVTVNVFAYLTN